MKFRPQIDKEKEEEVVATVHQPSELTRQIEELVRSYDGPDRIVAYAEDEMRILPFSDIECITILGGQTQAICKDGKQYRLKYRLWELETMLPEYFIRINKSAFANENRIKQFAATFSGAVDAVFHCGYREYVSRRCFAVIKRRYESK